MAETNEKKDRWLIVGAGSFGSAMTRILAERPVEVHLAARTSEQRDNLAESFENVRYFPGISLPSSTHFTTVENALKDQWDAIVLAVPTKSFQETIQAFANCSNVFVSLGKGLAPSGERLSEVAKSFIPSEQYVALSGPNIAREMMLDLPTAAVVAGSHGPTVEYVQQIISGMAFRVYRSFDITGVELAGATKNVIAIAAGVLEGSGLGDNAVAAMMTRGLGEMARLGLASGAQLQTYLGLAGVGDLMVTCRSPHSRNHRCGRMLANGKSPQTIRESIGQAIEGMRTAPIVRDLAASLGVEMHITEAVAQVVADESPMAEVLRNMMTREPGMEFSAEFALS